MYISTWKETTSPSGRQIFERTAHFAKGYPVLAYLRVIPNWMGGFRPVLLDQNGTEVSYRVAEDDLDAAKTECTDLLKSYCSTFIEDK